MTSAIEDMMIAHADAKGRTGPDFINVLAIDKGNTILVPGFYQWSSTFIVPTYSNITFAGGPDDVWLMQIKTSLTFETYSRMNLDGGARAENIFWVMSAAATIGTYAHTEGTFMAGTAITVATGATFEGAYWAQSTVTLDAVKGKTVTANYPDPTCEDSYPDYDSTLEPVDLKYAANFAILSKSGITTTPGSEVIGDMGTSPIDYAAITGFGLVLDLQEIPAETFSMSAMVTGEVFGANHAAPTPAYLTESVNNMVAAYTDAQGRINPDEVDLGGGNIDRMTLVPGLYKWSTGVTISSGVTFTGDANDVWIMQIEGDVIIGGHAVIVLCGGAHAANIFWAVKGLVDLGVGAQIQGIWLTATKMVFKVASGLVGAALAQTAVTLDNANIILAQRSSAATDEAEEEEEYLCV
jgi:hypothetical protein